jgi:hypothetical protein
MTEAEILAAEERRLRDDAGAYRLQEQGARWTAERIERMLQRLTAGGRHRKWHDALAAEGARQLAIAARAERGAAGVRERLGELARERFAAMPQERFDHMVLAAARMCCGECDTSHCGRDSDCGETCEVCGQVVPCTRAP